jgi:hypothetical protein
MRFTIDPELEIEGKKGRVPSGSYDAQLVNPNDKQASAKGVLAVVDKPVISETSPALLCLSQGEREMTLRGSGLLRIRGALPQVAFDGVDAGVGVSALEACTGSAGRPPPDAGDRCDHVSSSATCSADDRAQRASA